MSADMSFMRFVLIFSSNSKWQAVFMYQNVYLHDSPILPAAQVCISQCVCCHGCWWFQSLWQPLLWLGHWSCNPGWPFLLLWCSQWNEWAYLIQHLREKEQLMRSHESGLQFSYNSTQLQLVQRFNWYSIWSGKWKNEKMSENFIYSVSTKDWPSTWWGKSNK